MRFPTKPELKANYDLAAYDANFFRFVKTPSKYFLEHDLDLGFNPKDDCESSIKIFTELASLDKVQANDKRLWVTLTHTIFFNYVKQRWDITAASSENKIRDRYHFEGSGIDSRMGNAIARLWWTARVTSDKNRSDEFELTRLAWEKQDIQVALMERTFSTYPNVVQGFLEFYKGNKRMKEDELRLLLRGLNALGGVKLLPLLTKEEIRDEILRIAEFNQMSIA